MSDIIKVPYTHFDGQQGYGTSRDLAQQTQETIRSNPYLFEVRNMPGAWRRYGADNVSLDDATRRIEKGQRDHLLQDPEHYALLDEESGEYQGAASLYPPHLDQEPDYPARLPLYRLRLSLPPGFAKGILRKGYSGLKFNVHAWVKGDPNDPEVIKHLGKAYSLLGERAIRLAAGKPIKNTIWTVEPIRSPAGVHAAIGMSGLQPYEEGRFDDGESHQTPPLARLYTNVGRLAL
jgi:hypothetical protein